MKHPTLKQLQDYFENEISEQVSESLRAHLEECDKCSNILSEMAKVDVIFSKPIDLEVPRSIKNTVFANASVLLKTKRDKVDLKQAKKDKRKEQLVKTLDILKELKEGALSELKIPALQTAAISLFLVLLTKVATTETYIDNSQIINDDVRVINSEYLGDDNETY